MTPSTRILPLLSWCEFDDLEDGSDDGGVDFGIREVKHRHSVEGEGTAHSAEIWERDERGERGEEREEDG